MKDYKFYTKISLVFVTLYLLLAIGMVGLLLRAHSIDLLNYSLNSLEQQNITIKRVYAKISAIDKAFNEELLLQNIIEDSHTQHHFISIINWAGNYVCYPEIYKVGEKPASVNEFENETVDAEKIRSRYFTFFSSLKALDNKAPIIKLEPISNSDLIISNHVNLEEVAFDIQKKRTYYIIVISILGLILWLFILWVCRFLSNYFSKQIQNKVEELTINARSIEDLNTSLENYQRSLTNVSVDQTAKEEGTVPESELTKERILTYVRNELVPITISSIAYIYVENTITYIVTKDGKRSTTTDPLDKVYSLLNEKVYFKVNRQFIVNIEAIAKITKFENSKLKLEVNPASDLDIIIGKNKVSQFKQWLDL